VAQIEFIHPKTEKQFIEQALKERRLIALDPQGKTYSSELFSSLLFDEIEKGGSEVAFAIGAAEGLPKELKTQQLLSLSLLTFTHQMVRLILVEQIYRAFEIRKGSGYHK
jgi:23S rRNA (pseudouridine1915-N3)-methyltransferase